MKKLYVIAFVLTLGVAPICVQAQTEQGGIEMSMGGITLSIAQNNVHISGANGETMEIFNLTGARVASIKIDSNDKSFALNLTKGCYLVKVGKIVRKISIQ